MKKIVISILVLLISIIVVFSVIYFADFNLKIESIRKVDYDFEKGIITVEIETKKGILFSHDFKCEASNVESSIIENGSKNKCKISIPVEDNYKIVLSNKYHKTKELLLNDYIENKLDFKFKNEFIYLAVGEEIDIEYIDKYIVPQEATYSFTSDNVGIVKTLDNKIIGVAPGTTIIREKDSDEELKVIVTDLIIKPTLFDERKEVIPCNKYTNEDNQLLDNILKSKVEEAGYGTRAGAVAAARFLTLQIPYLIPYFYENGRVSDTGVNYVDGEGRYYREGLYLSPSKFDSIVASFSGPAIWGCPLRNWEDDPYNGYTYGAKMPNGLDCSGFVSWALVNGGFDPGDIGAGENEGIYQLTDLGEFTELSIDVIESGVIKVGDLFNYWGHIAIIIGYDGQYYYVAESLPNFKGVEVKIYNAQEAVDTFRYVVLMDKFYKEDGNYSEYWN